MVSEEWVASSTAPVVPDVMPENDRPDLGYGYQWWVSQHENGKTQIYCGRGFGGQFPFVVPEHEIVAVFNAWNIRAEPELASQLAIQERILPALLESTEK